MADYSLLCCVVNMGVASHVMKAAKKLGVQGGTIFLGRGTIHNRLLEFLQIIEERKEIVTMIVECEMAAGILKGIAEHMRFDKPHHGIAFSLPVTEFTGHKNPVDKKAGCVEMKDSGYKIIYVVVDRGMAEDVVESANKAGARGGTILNARGAGIHEAKKLFSVEIEPEKEEVFIIVKTEEKDSIIKSIKNDLKIDEPGNGIIFVMDVNEVYGLHEG